MSHRKVDDGHLGELLELADALGVRGLEVGVEVGDVGDDLQELGLARGLMKVKKRGLTQFKFEIQVVDLTVSERLVVRRIWKNLSKSSAVHF